MVLTGCENCISMDTIKANRNILPCTIAEFESRNPRKETETLLYTQNNISLSLLSCSETPVGCAFGWLDYEQRTGKTRELTGQY